MSECFFITATGTAIGKTCFTAALAWQLRHKNIEFQLKKPLMTGCNQQPNDVDILAQASGKSPAAIAGLQFSAPLSPDQAANQVQQSIDVAQLVQLSASGEVGIEIIEGVGGVMTPLNATETVRDWIVALENTRVILVTATYLGSLSHTLTALAALEQVGVVPHALVVMDNPHLHDHSYASIPSLEDVCVSLLTHSDVPVYDVPVCDAENNPWKVMKDVTQLVL